MNNKVFNDWITGVYVNMRCKGLDILLMLDTATSHGKEEDHQLSHAKVKFFCEHQQPPAVARSRHHPCF